MSKFPNPQNIPAGVVGMGLMGTSITACLLASGHSVSSIDKSRSTLAMARRNLSCFLQEMKREGLLQEKTETVMKRWRGSDDYSVLADCGIVIESIVEDVRAKRGVIQKIERVVSRQALIGSNTSAIPVTMLQRGTLCPERILGIHWAEPAHITRFMEIICGRQTGIAQGKHAQALAQSWGKEPSLLKKDIRGFITNRIMYAMLREAFHLVESGIATPEDIDRSVRNDYGYWITLAGPFRFMDLTGIQAYRTVMKDLFPDLNCSKKVPALMEKVFRSGAHGVGNHKGFYPYSPKSADHWEQLLVDYTYDIRKLATKYNKAAAAIEAGRRKRNSR